MNETSWHFPTKDNNPVIIKTTIDKIYNLKIEELISDLSYIGNSNTILNENGYVYLTDTEQDGYMSDAELFCIATRDENNSEWLENKYIDLEIPQVKYNKEYIYNYLNKSKQETQFDFITAIKKFAEDFGSSETITENKNISYEEYSNHFLVFMNATIHFDFDNKTTGDFIFSTIKQKYIDKYENQNLGQNSSIHNVENLHIFPNTWIKNDEGKYIADGFSFYIHIENNYNEEILLSDFQIDKNILKKLNSHNIFTSKQLSQLSQEEIRLIYKTYEPYKKIIQFAKDNNIPLIKSDYYNALDWYPDFDEE
jgi:hypothetical protein